MKAGADVNKVSYVHVHVYVEEHVSFMSCTLCNEPYITIHVHL